MPMDYGTRLIQSMNLETNCFQKMEAVLKTVTFNSEVCFRAWRIDRSSHHHSRARKPQVTVSQLRYRQQLRQTLSPSFRSYAESELGFPWRERGSTVLGLERF